MDEDVYTLNKTTKSKAKWRVSEDIEEEVVKIEEQNYEVAKNIRMELDKSALKQKDTTDELLRQGETLENAKKAAVGVNVRARKGSEIAENIEREGHIFGCEFICLRSIKNWFRGRKGVIDDVLDKRERAADVEKAEEVEFEEGRGEYIEGQNKTDKEMTCVLNTVLQIKREADKQNKEAGRQKTLLKDISVINERSEKVIKETDEELRKV